MFNRCRFRSAAFLVLFAVLFAQAAAAANSCLRQLSAPAAADAKLSAHCEALQLVNLNLCLYHCADQSDNSGAQLHAAAPPPLTVMLVLQPRAIEPRQGSQAHSPPTTDPPIPIRNCCFRI